jgi:hypothetical protein
MTIVHKKKYCAQNKTSRHRWRRNQKQGIVDSMNMRFLAVLAVIISSSTSFSDSLDTARPFKHSFQLQIGDYLSLKTFQNTWICYKYHFNTSKAIRVGLSLYANYNDNLGPRNSSINDFTESTENASLSFNSFFISYFYFNKTIKPYYGMGPFLSLSYYDDSPVLRGTLTGASKKKTIEGGLNGLIGLEWFFHNHFSLFTEYSLQGGYSYYSSFGSSGNEYKTNNFKLTTNNCLVGLSIYL